MKALQVSDLTKKYKEHLAVDHITFEVEEGELFAFLGENGAGKSTTINMLCTILEKTEGSVRCFDYELGVDDDEIRNSIGIVFQNSVLDQKLTVKENLFTRGSYYGMSKEEIKNRLAPFMESFELNEIWNRRYEKLSGGQRRRVDIVRALINNPKILFLDEPTTGLDPKSRKIVWDYIEYLRKEKHITIFLTTHYMEETKAADHVVILDHGKVIASGTPNELKTKYSATKLRWYVPQNELLETRLQGLDYCYEADHYKIYMQTDSKQILDFLNHNNDVITDFEVEKGSMDDVFLNLTGKVLGA